MYIPISLIAAAVSLLRPTLAVLADDAWNVDYHLALLGAPQEHTTFFHQPFSGSRASLLYTLSEQNILGAVNPKDGAIVWRQSLDKYANSTRSFLRAGENQDVVVSGVDGGVAAWSASDGRQIWTHDLQGASIKDLEMVEIPDSKQEVGSKDTVVLSTGPQTILSRLDGQDGHAKWSFRDDTGDEAYQVSASATEFFCIFLHKTMLGNLKIKVVSLDPTNGRKIDQYMLSSENDLESSADILSVGANTASPIIAWIDKARTVLKVNVIGSKAISTFPIDSSKAVEHITLHAPYHSNARPHFLVHYQTALDHWAQVYHVDLKSLAVTKAYDLPKHAGQGAFSTSESDANVYFARISEHEVSVVSSASHGILAKWPLRLSSGTISQSAEKPVHAVAELSVKSDSISAVRMAVYLASGDWILLRDGVISWQRHEALSTTVAAVWAYPPVSGQLVDELEAEGHSNLVQAYLHRVIRHCNDLTALPVYLSTLPSRLLHSIGIGSSTPEISANTQDSFGFHKTVICATKNGRLIALDAGGNGKILWNRPLEGLTLGQVPQLLPQPDGRVYVKSAEGKILSLVEASTGEILDAMSSSKSPTLPQVAFTFSLRNGKLTGGSTAGEPAWQFIPSGDQTIIRVTPRPLDDPVASIGKVLGDRRVLYKYLNPNVVMVTAVSAQENTATVSVVDTVSGSVLFTATHENVDVTLPIASTISENWFVYSFTSATSLTGGVKGNQLVVAEMYESPLPNDRGPLGASYNSSAIASNYEPHIVTQTYHIGERVAHMAVTQTRQGITSRLLLAVLPESNAIVGIPRPIIDPRRPVGRDPTSTEAMEGLMRYDPVLRFDPKWYLTHQREVLGVETISTSPAIIESTSLVFAYGLDIFGTRASPSFSFDVLGRDFNKLQMLATVAALAVATLFVAPLVKRKQINTLWQFA